MEPPFISSEKKRVSFNDINEIARYWYAKAGWVVNNDVDRIWPDRPDRTTYQLSGINCPNCEKEMQLVIYKTDRKRKCVCGYSEDTSD